MVNREALLDFQKDRNATLKLIEWFDLERVSKARIAVIGAGAIGNEVLKNLALLGVGGEARNDRDVGGGIFIFDRDTIEMSNLSRSILFRESDALAQARKAETAARAIKAINPQVNVFWCHGPIEEFLGEGFLRSMDVVIGCLDNLESRFLLNRLCWRARRPWIDAGIGALAGQVRAYAPPDGPCFECAFAGAANAGLSCNAIAKADVARGRVPTTPTIASLVAAIQVQECLKLLAPEEWQGRILTGRQFSYNSGSLETDITGLARREKCGAHVDIGDEDVVRLPGFSAERSAAELLREAVALFGAGAFIELSSEVALERSCPSCGGVLAIFRPKGRIVQEDLTCQCGRGFQWDSDITQTHRVTLLSPAGLLSAPLLQLGVARGGYVEVRYGFGEAAYVEMSGDLPGLVNRVEGAVVAAIA